MDGITLPIKHFRYSNNFLIISIWCCSSNKHIFTCENSNAKIRVSVLLSDLRFHMSGSLVYVLQSALQHCKDAGGPTRDCFP